MKIQVTQEHIDAGCMCDSDNCPVAHAINDVLGRQFFASVSMDIEIRRNIPEQRRTRLVMSIVKPHVVREFVNAFDGTMPFETYRNAIVQPFTFDLDLPAEVLREAVNA